MILDKQVLMKVNNRTAQLYKDKGYDVPMKIGVHGNMIFDTDKYFYVDVEDLEPTSTVKVNAACDICKTPKLMPYRDYYRRLDEDGLRTCTKCKTIKYKRTVKEKYGDDIENTSQLESVKKKVMTTNRERYGVDWCMESKECQEKRRITYIENYGCEWATQSDIVKEKTIQTNLQKYGVRNPTMTKEVQDKMKATMIERYGKENPMMVPEIRRKMESTNLSRYGNKCTFSCPEIYAKGIQSKYKNSTTPISRQQEYICRLYNGILNFPCSSFNLDIVLDNIDIEYDGKGHNLSVELGNISQYDFKVKEIVRDKIVKSNGYKIVRLISKTDKLPPDNILLKILDLSKEYFNSTDHSWIEWYFDENKFRNAENLEGSFFDFGNLQKLKKELKSA